MANSGPVKSFTENTELTLSARKIKLVIVEKKLGPVECECDALRYQRDTLIATIALMSEDWQTERA